MLILDAEAWVACLPRDHRLASRDEVEIAELLDDPIVCAPMSAGMWRDYWLAMDARGGREPTIAAVAATYEAETTCIARGLGIKLHDPGRTAHRGLGGPGPTAPSYRWISSSTPPASGR
jgi:DNA-binding transcriptional LysR family regulator